jgi:predicted PurR-regulated permease PerM
VEVRVVRVEARTVVNVLLIALAFAILLQVIWLSRQVLSWILVALFLALALNPAVQFFEQRGLRRGYAAAVTSLLTLAGLIGLFSLFVPTLVSEANDFVRAVPDYVEDISKGRGPLGDLAERYDVVERVRQAAESGGAASVLGISDTALAITERILTAIVAAVTIVFLTFFMLLEGPRWLERFFALLPDGSRGRWQRVGHQIYRSIGGYVTGNLLISVSSPGSSPPSSCSSAACPTRSRSACWSRSSTWCRWRAPRSPRSSSPRSLSSTRAGSSA